MSSIEVVNIAASAAQFPTCEDQFSLALSTPQVDTDYTTQELVNDAAVFASSMASRLSETPLLK